MLYRRPGVVSKSREDTRKKPYVDSLSTGDVEALALKIVACEWEVAHVNVSARHITMETRVKATVNRSPRSRIKKVASEEGHPLVRPALLHLRLSPAL